MQIDHEVGRKMKRSSAGTTKLEFNCSSKQHQKIFHSREDGRSAGIQADTFLINFEGGKHCDGDQQAKEVQKHLLVVVIKSKSDKVWPSC